jgi:hypothetical protein
MGNHLSQFFLTLGRVISARQKSDSTAASQDSPFVVERIFHPGVAKRGNITARCSEPFGESHPACSPEYTCSISKMSCSGKDVDVKSYNGSLAQCIVNQVTCSGGPSPSLAHKGACIPHELECDGKRVSAADAPPGAGATCSVYQLQCNATLLSFDPSASACPTTSDCESVCKEAGDVCTCSLDRVGGSCAKWRPYTCSFRLLSPQPNCQPSQGVDSDPVCFVFRRTQAVSFEYAIDCAFDAQPDPRPSPDPGFKYFLRNDKFAVSEAQAKLWPFQAQLKVFDFKWITDRTATQVVDLTAQQLAGNSSVTFSINFEQIPDRFFAGNRLYFEFGLSRASDVPERTVKYDRRFLDFEGLHISRSTHSALSAAQVSWIIAFSVGGFVFLVVLVYWIRNKIIACRRPKEHDY